MACPISYGGRNYADVHSQWLVQPVIGLLMRLHRNRVVNTAAFQVLQFCYTFVLKYCMFFLDRF